jgi:hypothetical protein
MIRPRKLGLHLTPIIFIAAQSTLIYAQSAPPSSQSPVFAVSLAMERDRIPMGQKPRAVVTIKNISQQTACFSTASSVYRVHVEGKDGDAPETELKRHLRSDFRPGDGPELDDGPVVCRNIAPGASDHQTYDLTLFYDLTAPGKYSVVMEIRDYGNDRVGPSVWLRTNTAQFEILPPAQ